MIQFNDVLNILENDVFLNTHSTSDIASSDGDEKLMWQNLKSAFFFLCFQDKARFLHCLKAKKFLQRLSQRVSHSMPFIQDIPQLCF